MPVLVIDRAGLTCIIDDMVWQTIHSRWINLGGGVFFLGCGKKERKAAICDDNVNQSKTAIAFRKANQIKSVHILFI